MSALDGIVVAELGARLGAGVCGSVLAQLGATVIVPERTEASEGKHRFRTQMMAGKSSVLLAGTGDDALLAALIERSDIVVTSSDTDGTHVEPTAARIVCDVTAFGDSGPLAGRSYSDAQIQALTGILDTTGLDDGSPTPIRLPIVEFMTGVYAAGACIAALRARRRGGRGQAIDMALYDTAFAAMSTFLPRLLDGSGGTVKRVGNRHPMASPWNVFPARDGWVLVCAASDVQWRRICQVLGKPELGTDPRYATIADRVARHHEVDGILQAWLSTGTIERSVAALGAVGVPCGPVTEVDEYPREANLVHRGMVRRVPDRQCGTDVFIPASPLRMSRTPGISPDCVPARDEGRDLVGRLLDEPRASLQAAGSATGALPLAGLRVLEIGHYTTAPLSARHLANLGADVIKVEPAGGEAVRAWPPAKGGTGVFFTYTNADKRSLLLDLESQQGTEVLRDLIARSDVLLENLKPGALAKRGFSAAEIGGINPRLVYCAVSGFGADTVYAGRPAYDTVIQAMSGFMDLTRAGEIPIKSGISSADLFGAEMALVTILAALEHRDRTGDGQSIDLSMQDAAAWMTMPLWNGRDRGPMPVIVEAQDGYVLVELEPGESETSLPSGLLERGRRMTRADLASALSEVGRRAAPVLSATETVEAEQTRARELVMRAEDETGESWPLLASPLRLKGTPPVVRRPMRPLGADNETILAELGRGPREPRRQLAAAS